jgi:hypothetical protein
MFSRAVKLHITWPAGCGRKSADADGRTAGDKSTPAVLPSILKIKRESKTYVITGIGLKGSTKVAIINDKVVSPGEEIDPGVFVKEVQPTYAIIVVGSKEHLLRPEDIQRELDKKKP